MGSTLHLHNHFIAKRFVLLRVLFLVRPNFGAVARGNSACDSAINRTSVAIERTWVYPAYSCACARLVHSCMRAPLSDRLQCACAFNHTSVAINRTCRDCHIFACMWSSHCSALERTFADFTNLPEIVYVINFQFWLIISLFLIVYLLCLFLFVYLLL